MEASSVQYVTPTGAVVERVPWVDPEIVFSLFSQETYAIWLDSSDRVHPLGKYSFIVTDPFDCIKIKQGQLLDNALSNPFDIVQERLKNWHEPWEGLSKDYPPFRGGFAGFFGYDLIQALEDLPFRHTAYRIDNMALPDIELGFYDCVIAFDLTTQQCFIFSTGFPETQAKDRHKRAEQRLQKMKDRIRHLKNEPIVSLDNVPDALQRPKLQIKKEDYMKHVQRVIDYIYEGDIFQANLSHGLTAEINPQDTAFDFYRRFRKISAAPFSSFCQFSDFTLASTSPERFLFCRDNIIATYPIKGTQPRGKNLVEDNRLKKTLQDSQKDYSENVMIVDVLRNDLSRICKDGTVVVEKLCHIETFQTVHHLVSMIQGELQERVLPMDVMKACFAGASITGAPKIRAMEIIAELENNARGPYCGSLGYIGFDGTMDMNIIIRTAIFKGTKVHFPIGSGIVVESIPEREYLETIDKAKGFLLSLGCDENAI